MFDYEGPINEARRQNLESLRKGLAGGKIGKKLDQKIASFAARFNLEPELIRYKILTDDLFVLHFVKDPGRQSIHQNLAFKQLASLPLVEDARLLPSSGPGSKFVVHGTVMTHEQQKNSAGDTKSIDFEWVVRNASGEAIRCFAAHKYTKEEGGSQDNQFRDLQSFMKQAAAYASKQMFFFAICDGAYYKRPFKEMPSRLEYLNKMMTGPRVKATTIDDLPDCLLDLT